jgi:hypothetical protein
MRNDEAMRIVLACCIVGMLMPPAVSYAQSSAGPSSSTVVRQASEGTVADTKARLREAGNSASAGASTKGQKLKQGVREAESEKPATWSYESDYSSCGFLTKPHVRADGGGLDAHKGGQVLCFQGRVMHCLQGRWRDRGRCSAGDSYPPQAWQMEGTAPGGQQLTPGGSPNDPGGQPSQPPQEPEAGGQGGTGLLGQSPMAQQLEEEMQQLRERDAELQRQRGDANRPLSTGTVPMGRSGPDAAKCEELRGVVSQADAALKQLRDYSRTQRDDGQISSIVRPQYNQIQSARQQAMSMQSQLGCR